MEITWEVAEFGADPNERRGEESPFLRVALRNGQTTTVDQDGNQYNRCTHPIKGRRKQKE